MRIEVETQSSGRRLDIVLVREQGDSWDKKIRPALAKIRDVPGVILQRRKEGEVNPRFTCPVDIQIGLDLKEFFEEEFHPGKFYTMWAREQTREKKKLKSILSADTYELQVIPKELPEMMEALHLGPRGLHMTPEERAHALAHEPPSYQAVDVGFLSHAMHPINTNQPGTGKTLETIAAVFERRIDNGPKLVVAPLTSLRATWEHELDHWQWQPVFVCDGGRGQRLEELEEVRAMQADGLPFWLCVNSEMLSLKSEFTKCPDHQEGRVSARTLRSCDNCSEDMVPSWPLLHDFKWNCIILDEFHQMGFANQKTKTSQGIQRMDTDLWLPTSGTPIGGKIMQMFSLLQILHPHLFTNKKQFQDRFLLKEKYYVPGGSGQTREKVVEEINPEMEEELLEMLSTFMVRRTKAEVLPWLPPKQYMNVWLEMSEDQRDQYTTFAEEAEIRIDELNLVGASILSEYTALRQFAFGTQRLEEYDAFDSEGNPVVKVRPYPTADSPKLDYVMQTLNELGIDENRGDSQIVIFSQFTKIVDFVCDQIIAHGIPAERITGNIAPAERDRIRTEFQSEGGCRVLVMNTKAGGTSITLDRASDMIILDETWNPDNQEQAEDRVHRGSRIHQVTIRYVRTTGTIEHHIEEVNIDKAEMNRKILDARRLGLRAV